MAEEKETPEVEVEDGRKVKFVAGVFVDPETGMFEVRSADESIDPYQVMLGAVGNYVQQLLNVLGVAHVQPGTTRRGPQIVRASGPLPPGMRRP